MESRKKLKSDKDDDQASTPRTSKPSTTSASNTRVVDEPSNRDQDSRTILRDASTQTDNHPPNDSVPLGTLTEITIDGKFDCGYLISAEPGQAPHRGVLYRLADKQLALSSPAEGLSKAKVPTTNNQAEGRRKPKLATASNQFTGRHKAKVATMINQTEVLKKAMAATKSNQAEGLHKAKVPTTSNQAEGLSKATTSNQAEGLGKAKVTTTINQAEGLGKAKVTTTSNQAEGLGKAKVTTTSNQAEGLGKAKVTTTSNQASSNQLQPRIDLNQPPLPPVLPGLDPLNQQGLSSGIAELLSVRSWGKQLQQDPLPQDRNNQKQPTQPRNIQLQSNRPVSIAAANVLPETNTEGSGETTDSDERLRGYT